MANLERDPHVMARGVVVSLQHPVMGAIRTAASPLRFSESPVTYRSAPPLTGEHTDEVLGQWLGIDADRLQRLRTAKVI
jgi:crotonobetainyl-CoA:carnitine CoA-transferase CaiB-like acyl-CoA transferase